MSNEQLNMSVRRYTWLQRLVGFLVGIATMLLLLAVFESFGWSAGALIEGIGAVVLALAKGGTLVLGFIVVCLIIFAVLFGGWKLIEHVFKKESDKPTSPVT